MMNCNIQSSLSLFLQTMLVDRSNQRGNSIQLEAKIRWSAHPCNHTSGIAATRVPIKLHGTNRCKIILVDTLLISQSDVKARQFQFVWTVVGIEGMGRVQRKMWIHCTICSVWFPICYQSIDTSTSWATSFITRLNVTILY